MHWVELKLPYRVCWSTSKCSSNRTLKSATATTRSNVRFCPNTPKIRYKVDKGNPLVWVENHNRPFSDIQFLKPCRRKWSDTGNQNYLHSTENFWIELNKQTSMTYKCITPQWNCMGIMGVLWLNLKHELHLAVPVSSICPFFFRSQFWPIDAVWNLNQLKFVQYLSISNVNATTALHANLEIKAIFHSSSCSCTW